MKLAGRAALFASLCVGTGIVFGVYIAFFAQEYAKAELVKSRRLREPAAEDSPVIIQDNGWKK